MFKKMIGILSGFAVTAVTGASVVSCTAPQFADGQDHQRVVVVTDGGHVNDRAFNQDAYEGVTKFNKDAFNHGSKRSYVEPQDSNYANLVSGYRLAVVKKANALVLPGFTHASVVPGAESFLKNTSVILVDCEYDAPNVISIQFNSQLAGFLAGFNTSYWATTRDANGKLQGDKNGDGHISIGTFIGSSNKWSTDNYSWGLLLGMATYNAWVDKHPELDRAKVYSANTPDKGSDAASEEISKVRATGKNDASWYSGSFAPGDAVKVGIISKLIDVKKADIMFPVAGGQVTDVITYATPTYMIGVDVDQAVSYPDAKGRFITSAVKNIHQAVVDALYRAQSKDRPNTLDIKDNKYKDQYWLGTTPTPLMSWSTNYTKENNTDYLLDKDAYTFINPNNANQTAQKGSIADYINNEYENVLGDDPKDYLNGSAIVNFAESLITKYASEFSTVGQENGHKIM